MAPTALCVALLLFLASHCQAQDLASYEKSKILISGQYELYWTYRAADSRMDMAVRVKTLGWFGLGISPDGQMSNSDVVTGWVTAGGMAMLQVIGLQMIGWCTPHVRLLTNGINCVHIVHTFALCQWRNVLLQDRFADGRSRPPVDTQQDWTMVSGREENGWTIMAFSRTLQTGDTRDRDIVQVCMATAVCIHTAMQAVWLLWPNVSFCIHDLACASKRLTVYGILQQSVSVHDHAVSQPGA